LGGGSGLVERWRAAAVAEVPVVGLDVEWKPSSLKSSAQNPASILQVAWRHHLIIFDLFWMRRVEGGAAEGGAEGAAGNEEEGGGAGGRARVCESGAEQRRVGVDEENGSEGEVGRERVCASAVIQRLLTCETVLKLGFDFANDMAKLKASSPGDMGACFEVVTPFLDVAAWSSAVNGSKGNSLRRTVEACLGLQLDKQQQMSDWERRPLLPEQVCTLHPTPYTLHPTPYTLHPAGAGRSCRSRPCAYTCVYAALDALAPHPNSNKQYIYILNPEPYAPLPEQVEYAALDALALCLIFDQGFPVASPPRFQEGRWTILVHTLSSNAPHRKVLPCVM